LLRRGLRRTLHKRAPLAGGRIGEAERGQHEDDGDDGRHLPEKCPRAAAPEDRLAGASEYGAHVGALARLQQNDKDQDDTDGDMNDGNENVHFLHPLIKTVTPRKKRIPEARTKDFSQSSG
jgi:hypothetical protein